ncbi:hypothetical protein LM597_00355 [Candidatus Acetothermia bacterium]|nr:hypothetical protein [Candidatus Acetothermia bacterium]
MKGEGLPSAFAIVLMISSIAIGLISMTLDHKTVIGPTLILLALLSLAPLKFVGRTIKSCFADIVFGSIDTFFLGIAAMIGASFAGILGAIVGAAAGDAITDGFSGLWEGRAAQYLRKHGIEEARTPLSASLGKMSGCFLGIGVLLTLVWTIRYIL